MDPLGSQWINAPSGATSDCYYHKTNDSIFLKVFHDNIPYEVSEREFQTVSRIRESGCISVPAALEQIEDNGRKGIIYERIEGKTYAHLLKERQVSPEECAEKFGKEARKLHDTEMDISWLPSIYDEIGRSIDSVYQGRWTRLMLHRTLDMLHKESGKDVFLHGDMHPGNIMVTEKGFCWIDIGLASRGSFFFDLSAVYSMLNFPVTYLFMYNPYGMSNKEMKRLYTRILSVYFQTEDKKEIRKRKMQVGLFTIYFGCNVIAQENWPKVAKFTIKVFVLLRYLFYRGFYEHL